MVMYSKTNQIKKWLVLYFTSNNNDSPISKYLNIDVLEHINEVLRFIILPNTYYIKMILNSNLETTLNDELDYFTIFLSCNGSTINQNNDNYINNQLNTIKCKLGENMMSNYKLNSINKNLNILLPTHNSYILSIRNYDKKLNSKLINNMEIIYWFYDSNMKPFMTMIYKLNSKSDKYIKPDGIYKFEYSAKPMYSKFDMKLIYLTIPKQIKLY